MRIRLRRCETKPHCIKQKAETTTKTKQNKRVPRQKQATRVRAKQKKTKITTKTKQNKHAENVKEKRIHKESRTIIKNRTIKRPKKYTSAR